MLGVSPADFIQMSPTSQQFLLSEKRRFKSLAMEIEATYNGTENRLSYTCKRIYQGDQWPVANKYLLEMLADYRERYFGEETPR